VYFKNWVQKC